MGWWSKTIMGGDTPLDFQSVFFDKMGVDQFNDSKKEVKKAFENGQDYFITGVDAVLNRWGCGNPDEEFYIDYKSIGFQVLAVIMMEHGIKINQELKVLMLECIPNDEWAKEDSERNGYVQNLIDSLKAYEGSKPVKTTSKGLLEAIAEKINNK
jgi:hypothetical protein